MIPLLVAVITVVLLLKALDNPPRGETSSAVLDGLAYKDFFEDG